MLLGCVMGRGSRRPSPGNGRISAVLTKVPWSALGTAKFWSRWSGSKAAAFARYGSSISEGNLIDVDHCRAQADAHYRVRRQGGRHRITRGAGGDPERAYSQLDWPSFDPQKRLPLAPRVAGYGRPAAAVVGLPQAGECRTLRDVDRTPRSAPLTRR